MSGEEVIIDFRFDVSGLIKTQQDKITALQRRYDGLKKHAHGLEKVIHAYKIELKKWHRIGYEAKEVFAWRSDYMNTVPISTDEAIPEGEFRLENVR